MWPIYRWTGIRLRASTVGGTQESCNILGTYEWDVDLADMSISRQAAAPYEGLFFANYNQITIVWMGECKKWISYCQ